GNVRNDSPDLFEPLRTRYDMKANPDAFCPDAGGTFAVPPAVSVRSRCGDARACPPAESLLIPAAFLRGRTRDSEAPCALRRRTPSATGTRGATETCTPFSARISKAPPLSRPRGEPAMTSLRG